MGPQTQAFEPHYVTQGKVKIPDNNQMKSENNMITGEPN